MGGEGEQAGIAAAAPAARPGDGLPHPAVVGGEGGGVAVVVAATEGALGEEVVEDHVVQGQDPGALEGEVAHRRVVAVVAHLVERQAAAGAGLSVRPATGRQRSASAGAIG